MNRNPKENLKERFGVEQIALYGSFAKGGFTEENDVVDLTLSGA